MNNYTTNGKNPKILFYLNSELIIFRKKFENLNYLYK